MNRNPHFECRHGSYYMKWTYLSMDSRGTNVLKWILLIMLMSFILICESVGPDKFITSRNMFKHGKKEKFTWESKISEDDTKHLHFRKKRSLPTADGSKAAIDIHNHFRATIGDEGEEPIPSNMMYVTWDPSLAITATIYAEKCIFEHSVEAERSTKDFPEWNGENLWAGSGKFAGKNFDPEVGITSWFREYLDYDFDTHFCKPGKKCGHYTQVVWSDSYKLGCGWVNCSTFDTTEGEFWTDAAYMVCHYAPGGNIDNVKLYKVGPRCSECNPEDTCPDGRLCRNEIRDVILPGPSDGGHVFTILLCALGVGVLLLLAGYFTYTHRQTCIGAWRKRRKIGHKAEPKPPVPNPDANGNTTTLPGMVP